jgi:hypothetical protein
LGRGAFGYRTWYTLGALHDGTSNTALYAERCLGHGTDRNSFYGVLRVKESGVFNYDGGIWTPGAGTATVQYENVFLVNRNGCLDTRGSNGEYKTGLTGIAVPGGYDSYDGANYTDGHFWITGFHTVLPPNAPFCIRRGSVETGIFTPSSNHSGGIQLALADGSVRFVPETVDVGTGVAAVTEGPSPFGVWGALGSRDGGEAVALP